MMGKVTKKKTAKSKAEKKPLKFFASHFWELMKAQDYKCALTGRELTPDNTEVELRVPFKSVGRTDFSNHYIVLRQLAYTARHVTEEEIVELAADIIRYRGKEFGYALRKA